MSSPEIDQTYTGQIDNISRTDNPMVQKGDWDYPAVILTSDTDNFSVGEQIEFVVKQEMESHYQARLPGRQSSLSSPTFDRIYRGEVFRTSSNGNPIIRHAGWDMSVVIITESSETFSKGDNVEFVVKKEVGKRYQALLSHKAPAVKPRYNSRAVIPIHHDGKDNQSVGDTRSDKHATRSLDDRN